MAKEDLMQIKHELKKEQRKLNINRVLRNKLAVSGFIIMVLIILLAILAPTFYAAGPYDMQVVNRLKAPEAEHILGTDTFGRDLLSRIAYGARVSLSIGAAVTVLSSLFGIIIGLYASYYKVWGQRPDAHLRRYERHSAAMLLAIALMAVLGPNIINVVISTIPSFTPLPSRVSQDRQPLR